MSLFRKETHFLISYAYSIMVKTDVLGTLIIEPERSKYPTRELIEECIKNDNPGARDIKLLSVTGMTRKEFNKLFK